MRRLMEIHTEKAKAYPGVTAVVTWKDVDRDYLHHQRIYAAQAPPHHGRVRPLCRDAVALVVAETEDIAVEAMKLIDVKYQVLKPVFTIEEGHGPGAPQLYPRIPRKYRAPQEQLKL